MIAQERGERPHPRWPIAQRRIDNVYAPGWQRPVGQHLDEFAVAKQV